MIVANQAQVVSLRFDGGEERINKLVDVAGGLNVGTADPAGVAEAIRDAVEASSNRILIEFPGPPRAINGATLRSPLVTHLPISTIKVTGSRGAWRR